MQEAGHYYTVYYVSLAVGFERNTAYKNALFAQMPDEVTQLDATSLLGDLGIAFLKYDIIAGDFALTSESSCSLEMVNATTHSIPTIRCRENPYKKKVASRLHDAEVQLRLLWTRTILMHKWLHVLNGGDALKERGFRRDLTTKGKPGTLEFGLNLHAFGDSYAHTRMSDLEAWFGITFFDDVHKVKRLYKTLIGHGLHFHAPDLINNRPELYVTYVKELYDALYMAHYNQLAKSGVVNVEVPTREEKEKTVNNLRKITNLKTEKQQIESIRATTMGSLMRGYKPEGDTAEENTPKLFNRFAAKHGELAGTDLNKIEKIIKSWGKRRKY